MKKYIEYMDGVTVSDTLHQRLLALESYQKRPAWMKYGAMAAALLLVAGLGFWGIRQGMHTGHDTPLYFTIDANAEPGIPDVDIAEPALEFEPSVDIAPVEPGDAVPPGMKAIGGYEVRGEDSGPDTTVAYYVLPYIEYGMAKDVAQMALDWDLPMGSTRRDLAQADIAALFGGAENLSTHLDWDSYELSGWAGWYADGSFWGAYLYGYAGPLDHFEFAFTTGNTYPPTCIGYPDGVEQEIWGLTVTAFGYDGQHGCDRRVEFLKDGCGFRFDITGSDVEQTCKIVSRLVRWIATEGLAPDAVTADGAELAHPWEDPNYVEPGSPVGEPNWED